jgi:hypothetical protein
MVAREPGTWTTEEILRYERDRWRKAVDADTAGELIVLDGDPFKLYYTWAQRKLDQIAEADWRDEVERFAAILRDDEYGLADLVLYADHGSMYSSATRKPTRRGPDATSIFTSRCGPVFEWYRLSLSWTGHVSSGSTPLSASLRL